MWHWNSAYGMCTRTGKKYKDLLKAADNSNGGKSHTRAGGWRQGRRIRGERGG